MPMRMGVRGKLFLVSVAMVLAVVFLAGLYLEGQLVEWAQGRAEVELQGHARLVRVLLEHRQDGDSDLDALADRAAAPIDARVTIIAADGRVVGDSEFPAGRLGEMEPHGDRPEVIAALRDDKETRLMADLGRMVELQVEQDATGRNGRLALIGSWAVYCEPWSSMGCADLTGHALTFFEPAMRPGRLVDAMDPGPPRRG